MTTQVQAKSAFDVRTGTIAVAGSPVYIARERDFQEFIEQAPAGEKFSLKEALQDELRKLGETRSAVSDLLRMRLRQLRGVIAQTA